MPRFGPASFCNKSFQLWLQQSLRLYSCGMEKPRTYQSLAFAGALPLVACALLPFIGVESVSLVGALDAVAGSYGLAILSFVAGTHWALQLLRPSETPFNLFVSSNVVFLAVWIGWLVAPLNQALIIQAAAFTFLLHVDRRLAVRGITSRDYLRVRSVATGAAFASLLLIALVHA